MRRRFLIFSLLAAAAAGYSVAQVDESLSPKQRERLAGAAIQSDRWLVHRDAGQEEFIGHVHYVHEGDSFSSDWALRDKRRGTFKARGRCYAKRTLPTGELLEGWSDRAVYDVKRQTGRAEPEPGGKVKIRRTTPAGDVLNGTALASTWDGEGPVLGMEGSAELVGSSETARGENAAYAAKDKSLTLTGGPPVIVFRGETFQGAMQAETVRLFPDDGKLQGSRQAHGWVHFNETKSGKSP